MWVQNQEEFSKLMQIRKEAKTITEEEALAKMPPSIRKKYLKGIQDGSIRPRGTKPAASTTPEENVPS